jgi:DNA-binding GntR family transcriptional regulator
MIVEKKIHHPSLVDRLVEHVFQAVIEGKLQPGSKVTEDQIAADFGVSRTPVREAVKRLSEMGVLVIRPRCGLEVVSIDERDLAQIGALRAELESFALRLALAHMGDDGLKALELAAVECETVLKGGNRVEIFRADSRFHLMLADLSGNRYLAEMLRRLDVKVQLCRMFICASMPKVAASVRFHKKLLDAIRKRDAAKAEQLLREHIGQSAQKGERA